VRRRCRGLLRSVVGHLQPFVVGRW
jgi:hypothetical protein